MTKQFDFHGRSIHALTVSDLRKRLEELPDDLVLTTIELDSEWDVTYKFAVVAVGDSGLLSKQMIGSKENAEDWWYEEDDEPSYD
jgi:hypothetical protein